MITARVFRQVDNQVMQQTKENKTIHNAGDCSNQISLCPSSKQVCRLSGLYCVRVFSEGAKETNEKTLKQAEESLRTVMYLSCWGPNS